MGMIARNAVILIEQIETERAEGRADMGRRRSRYSFALPPDHADGDFDGSRLHSDCPDRVLGSDGFRDHGRPVRGDDADADRPARALRRLVPGQGARASCGVTGRHRAGYL